MNKEQLMAALDDLKVKQDLYLLCKLEQEYNDLSDRCNKLYSFLYGLDFENKVEDQDERILTQEQHKRMEAYRTNLYQRIQHHRNKIKLACGFDIFAPWSEVVEHIKQVELGHGMLTMEQFLGQMDEQGRIKLPMLHHCGQDCDDACCQVRGDKDADVVDYPVITGESIKKLMDYQVVGVCEPGFPCEGCVQDHYNTPCCKVELVGGYMLCLAPLPNSIMMDKPCS